MKKNEKIILGVLGLGLVVGAYFYFTKNKNGDNKMARTDNSDEEVQEDIPTESNFPLSKGSRGAEVLALQQFINRSAVCKKKMPKPSPNTRVMKVLPLDEDGIFGELTQLALNSCYGTTQVDEAMWKRMNSNLPSLTVEG
jgi:hypothetical protein